MRARHAVVRWVATVESTQDAVHALAGQGASEGTAVAAMEQTAGRGSRRSDWSSRPGGLWMSVLLRPARESAMQALGLRAGLAVVRTLEALGVRGLMIKWPNDIMASDRKAGGILCEARWNGERPAWVAVGVGLNVSNALPEELSESATRLADQGLRTGLEELAQAVGDALVEAGQATGPLSATELDALAERDWLVHRMLESPEAGRAEGMEPDGALRVRRADGSVVLVRAAPVETAVRVTLTE